MIVLESSARKSARALQSVAGIVERRHTLPILANVLLRKTGESRVHDQRPRNPGPHHGRARWRCWQLRDHRGARKLIDILRMLPADQVVTLTPARTS